MNDELDDMADAEIAEETLSPIEILHKSQRKGQAISYVLLFVNVLALFGLITGFYFSVKSIKTLEDISPSTPIPDQQAKVESVQKELSEIKERWKTLPQNISPMASVDHSFDTGEADLNRYLNSYHSTVETIAQKIGRSDEWLMHYGEDLKQLELRAEVRSR